MDEGWNDLTRLRDVKRDGGGQIHLNQLVQLETSEETLVEEHDAVISYDPVHRMLRDNFAEEDKTYDNSESGLDAQIAAFQKQFSIEQAPSQENYGSDSDADEMLAADSNVFQPAGVVIQTSSAARVSFQIPFTNGIDEQDSIVRYLRSDELNPNGNREPTPPVKEKTPLYIHGIELEDSEPVMNYVPVPTSLGGTQCDSEESEETDHHILQSPKEALSVSSWGDVRRGAETDEMMSDRDASVPAFRGEVDTESGSDDVLPADSYLFQPTSSSTDHLSSTRSNASTRKSHFTSGYSLDTPSTNCRHRYAGFSPVPLENKLESSFSELEDDDVLPADSYLFQPEPMKKSRDTVVCG
eukprot:TRINITY_DN31404_c0_g1_i1.p1 TRINITY_DN31404_c0_g1~~TRINITY_DN31404_c0_g1_i1.p1  ORF type:complete len:355 (+),score=79.72 TRINITY_DN31404_c0_g1_i1:136-1200(+)